MKKYLLPESGNFYKANLHCHTTLSDGRLTPEEIKELYKSQGYSIVAYTDHNILSVTATTAQPMSREQVKRLTAKLSTITGKTVQLANQIDSAVIGGVRLDYDGKRLDDTIANRMDSIRNLLKNTVL